MYIIDARVIGYWQLTDGQDILADYCVGAFYDVLPLDVESFLLATDMYTIYSRAILFPSSRGSYIVVVVCVDDAHALHAVMARHEGSKTLSRGFRRKTE